MRLAERSVLVLTSLAGGDRHGYGLIKDIESFSGVALSPGTFYGALAKLEGDGFVQRLPGDDRRYPYRLTPAGRAVLAERLAESARIASLGLSESLWVTHEQPPPRARSCCSTRAGSARVTARRSWR
jgi:DNA-binding PadR family transcriptional regulator